jgi:hypothetical protein
MIVSKKLGFICIFSAGRGRIEYGFIYILWICAK